MIVFSEFANTQTTESPKQKANHLQGVPLPVIIGVITPISRVITHLIITQPPKAWSLWMFFTVYCHPPTTNWISNLKTLKMVSLGLWKTHKSRPSNQIRSSREISFHTVNGRFRNPARIHQLDRYPIISHHLSQVLGPSQVVIASPDFWTINSVLLDHIPKNQRVQFKCSRKANCSGHKKKKWGVRNTLAICRWVFPKIVVPPIHPF